MYLEKLLEKEEYFSLVRKMARGEVAVEEIEDLLPYVDGNRKKLEDILVALAKKLMEINRPIIYPVELIIVPRFPFSKRPLIEWGSFKVKDFKDSEVNKVKDISSRLGYLINTGFIAKHFVLIDVDSKNVPKSLEFDTETARGFHKLFYLPKFPAVEVRIGGQPSFKYKIMCSNIPVEIMSGSNYLISNPLQSRYIQVENGKFNVRRYRIISKRADYAFSSADLTPLISTVDDIKDFLCRLLSELGCSGYCRELELKPLEKEEITLSIDNKDPKSSKFNSNPLPVIGTLSYEEFKNLLGNKLPLLPACLRHALFDNLHEGERYCFARLLVVLVPFFVQVDDRNLETMAKEFAERSGFRKVRMYYWKYFSGLIQIDESVVRAPSKLGVPEECWGLFETSGYCNSCPLRESCKNRSGSEKRRLIVSYIEELLGSAQ